MAKLIVLRGNLESGTSVIAQSLQDLISPQPLLIDYDVVRRETIKEYQSDPIISPGSIVLVVRYGLKQGRDVIVEGNLQRHMYGRLMGDLNKIHPKNTFFYYFSKDDDAMGFANEKIISDPTSVEDSVTQIINDMNASER